MTIVYSTKDLDYVFGNDSTGDTPEERAKTSQAVWVRTQNQLSHYRNMDELLKRLAPQAPLKPSDLFLISSVDALRIANMEKLNRTVDDNSIVIVTKQPGLIIRKEREKRGWSQEELAAKAAVTLVVVQEAEDVDLRSKYTTHFVPLCKALNLDPVSLGV